MKVKLTLRRQDGPEVDVVVTTDASAPIGAVAQALLDADPHVSPTRAKAPKDPTLAIVRAGKALVALQPEVEMGSAALGSGAIVVVVDAQGAAPSSTSAKIVADVTVTAGPDAGTRFELPIGTHYVGRDPSSAVVLRDSLVSKKHARIDVTARGVRVVDLNSANGILLDGEPVSRLDIAGGEALILGDSTIQFASPSAPSGEARAVTGPVSLLRSPRVEQRYGGSEFVGPEVPSEVENQPFPWLAMIAPLIMGSVMFAVTRSPLSIMFVALSPLLMAGNYLSGRSNRKRKFRIAVEKFTAQLEELDRNLAVEVELERTIRLAEHPSTAEVCAAAEHLGSLLWTRRPEHWSFLAVRAGLGTLNSRNTVKVTGEESAIPEYMAQLKEVVERYGQIDGVPVVENLFGAGALGIAGPVTEAAGTARALLAQLTGLHSPAELVVTAVVGAESGVDFEWLKWLPHASSPQSPIEGSHLANSATSATALLAMLEEVVEVRLGATETDAADAPGRGATTAEASALECGAKVGREPDSVEPPSSATPAIVLLVTEDAPIDRARVVQLSERAADAGVFPIWVGASVASLPAVARTFVDLRSGDKADVGFVRQGTTITVATVESLSRDGAMAFAKSIAPVSDAGAHVVDISDLPQSTSLLSLLGADIAAGPERAVERWKQNDSIHNRSGAASVKSKRAGRLRAIVGHGVLDAMHLDLRSQGPHALVGGTTGSGKSEFLQAWVLGMAAEYSPDRVTFLFVDYKGGAAFADCVNLPHTVGLVTDLNQHLVRRALTSLRAELHYRERLLGRKKAKDLLELERRGDPESPPALVIVIDEFAALVGEVPEFVDGVVDVAQRGRSLGIHLIMATQRPAGVIRDNLRANTNLRIALRMADENDSIDVVGEAVAAGFDPSLPGRAVAKTGPGRLTAFQAAYAGGWTTDQPLAPVIDVAELRFGSPVAWERPEAEEPDLAGQGPTDQQRLVRSLSQAAVSEKIPVPRRPWLDPLPMIFDLTKLRQRTDTELLLGVRDVPSQQAQEEVYFLPDQDGSIAVFGTGGSGKTVTLRTLAVAAGITPRGGPVDVYGIDYATGGLGMLEELPHVGSIVSGDDPERVIRLLRTLRDELDARGPRYAAAKAGSITDYRRLAGAPDERRILLLLDGFAAFRQEFEATSARAPWYAVLQQIISEGRGLGMHVALAADRSASVPSAISAAIQRRVVLRMADETGYGLLDVPADILGPSSPPGRAILDGLEAQIAVAGGVSSVADQAQVIADIGAAMEQAGRAPAPPVGVLRTEYLLRDLPKTVGKYPLLGISEDTLEPMGFDPTGTLLLAGPPGSGRSAGLASLVASIERAIPDAEMYYFGNSRSELASSKAWKSSATAVDKVSELAKTLRPKVEADGAKKIVVVVESISDFLSTPADEPLVALIKAAKRSSNLLIGEAETSSWSSSWPLLAEIKTGRTGILLQPDYLDGETIFKTVLPRTSRADFPPGRGYYVTRGKYSRVQLPLASASGREK
jgi:S-DNA-T family DNA segregation ATPase FtsK/SpoIIIE